MELTNNGAVFYPSLKTQLCVSIAKWVDVAVINHAVISASQLYCHPNVLVLRGLRPGPQHFKKRAASLLQSRCQWVRRRTSRLKNMSRPRRTAVHKPFPGTRTRSADAVWGRQINPISGNIGPSYFECTSHDVVHERALVVVVVVVVPLVNIVRLRGSCVMAWNATQRRRPTSRSLRKYRPVTAKKNQIAIIWLLSYAST